MTRRTKLLLAAALLLTSFYPLISLLNTGQVAWNKRAQQGSRSSNNELDGEDATPPRSQEQQENKMSNTRNNDNQETEPEAHGNHNLPDPALFREEEQRRPYPSYQSYPNPFTKDKKKTALLKLQIPHRLIHLDLKGAPPKLSYLRRVLPILKAAGCTGLLLEYEDMFPFQGSLRNATNLKHFSQKELASFLRFAGGELGLEIIPLVQTFGHLESILKLDEFKGLREVAQHPQEICPSKEKAKQVVWEMLDQVISFHEDHVPLNYVHIGCDEVFHIGLCELCAKKGISELFLGRVGEVAGWLERRRKGLRGIIWDDMLRKMVVQEGTSVPGNLDLMVWDYTENVDNLVPSFLWPTYTKLFPNIWVASAFKGAFGESLYRVEVKRHALNHMSWIQTITRELPSIPNFRGFAITGWSRYDHFAILCELLPPAIPSAVLSLEILREQNTSSALQRTCRALNCSSLCYNFQQLQDSFCAFPGSEISVELDSLHFVEESWKRLKGEWGNSGKGWLTRYNLKHNSTSFWRLEGVWEEVADMEKRLRLLRDNLRAILPRYYDYDVVTEWMEERVGWLQDELGAMKRGIEGLKKRTVWGRRG